jgi:hypothetical protein
MRFEKFSLRSRVTPFRRRYKIFTSTPCAQRPSIYVHLFGLESTFYSTFLKKDNEACDIIFLPVRLCFYLITLNQLVFFMTFKMEVKLNLPCHRYSWYSVRSFEASYLDNNQLSLQLRVRAPSRHKFITNSTV